MKFTSENPLVLSSTSLASYKRCPKAYQLQYVLMRDTPKVSDAIEDGRSFHVFIDKLAKGELSEKDLELDSDPMAQVAFHYVRYKPLPENVVGNSELAVWARLLPNVLLRCTFDIIYMEDGWLVAGDYKTFDKLPHHDPDLDFQGGLYLAQLAHTKQWSGYKDVRFEWKYVRRVPPGTKNSKGVWTVDECYPHSTPLILPKHEIDSIWRDAQETATEMLRKLEFVNPADIMRNPSPWTRTYLKGSGPHTCNGCFVKEMCKYERKYGSLDDSTISFVSIPRKPLEVPEGV
jgi:hypothetical protein